jgi:hypothetical protein
MTLEEDFGICWNLPKYKDVTIPARQLGETKIKARHGSNTGWPGPEEDVKYWVELENGWAIGVLTPRKTNATFPMYMVK